MRHFLILLLGVLSLATASRFQSSRTSLAADASTYVGKVLNGRFQLQELLHSRAGHLPVNEYSPVVQRALGEFPWASSADGPLSEERYLRPEWAGAGGFAETWRAWDAKEGLEVALKIAKAGRGKHYASTRGLRRERSTAQALHEECLRIQTMYAGESSYPEGKSHICRCLESHALDEASDVSFIVMEFCGTSLDDIWEGPPRNFSDVRHWMKGCLKAIRFMSGLDPPMIHGDLHMGNVVVNAQNEAKLIDFGLAKPAQDAAQPLVNGKSIDVSSAPWTRDVFFLSSIYRQLLSQFATSESRDRAAASAMASGASPSELLQLLQ